MDKYLAKPTKIITENGFSYNLDNYIEHNLPCGGSSGTNNNQSINNLIAEIDARVEALEGQNVSCLDKELSLSPFMICSDEALTLWQLDKNQTLTNTVSMWIDTISNAAYAAYFENDVIKNKINPLKDLNLTIKRYTSFNDSDMTYSLRDFPIYLYNAGLEIYDMNYGTFGRNAEIFSIPDALHTLIDLHNLTQHNTNIIMNGFVIPMYEDIETLKTSSGNGDGGKCLETNITALPYEAVSDEAIALNSGYALRKDLPMTRSTTDWIKTLARIAYAPFMELPIINNKFATIQEQISQLQSSAASTTGDDLLVIDQQLSTLNNRVTLMENNVSNNTTKIGVHTTDIAAMQNRIVDLETTVNTQSQLINELISRIEALEK